MSQNTPSQQGFGYYTPQLSTPLTPLLNNGFFPSYPASLSLTPIYNTPGSPTPQYGKQKGKENHPSISKRSKKAPLLLRTTGQKLQLFYGFLKHELDWTYGELLYHTSIPFSGELDTNTPNETQKSIPDASREQMAATMRHFFAGNGKYTPSIIIQNWYKHAYGRIERDSKVNDQHCRIFGEF